MKAMYPRGTRVRLIRCADIYTALEPGMEGTVQMVDDLGTVHVAWDGGGALGLCAPEDAWEVIT